MRAPLVRNGSGWLLRWCPAARSPQCVPLVAGRMLWRGFRVSPAARPWRRGRIPSTPRQCKTVDHTGKTGPERVCRVPYVLSPCVDLCGDAGQRLGYPRVLNPLRGLAGSDRRGAVALERGERGCRQRVGRAAPYRREGRLRGSAADMGALIAVVVALGVHCRPKRRRLALWLGGLGLLLLQKVPTLAAEVMGGVEGRDVQLREKVCCGVVVAVVRRGVLAQAARVAARVLVRWCLHRRLVRGVRVRRLMVPPHWRRVALW